MASRGLIAATLPLVFACTSETPPPRTAQCPPGAVVGANAPSPSGAPAATTPPPAPPTLHSESAPLLAVAPDADPPQLGKIGDLPLQSGDVIKDCQIEYRTLGAANADKSNVVVWATWFS